jgi:pimeloyl-ACP methyl ester carboxylesterase
MTAQTFPERLELLRTWLPNVESFELAGRRTCCTRRIRGGWPRASPRSYEEHGAGEPLMCIHGTLSSAALWRDAVTELGTRGRAIVYDRRGFAKRATGAVRRGRPPAR